MVGLRLEFQFLIGKIPTPKMLMYQRFSEMAAPSIRHLENCVNMWDVYSCREEGEKSSAVDS